MTEIAEDSLSCEDARERFDDLLRRAVDDKERVILSREGRPVAALVPIEDLEFLEAIEDRLDLEEMLRAKEEFLRSGDPAIPLDEVVRELGIKD